MVKKDIDFVKTFDFPTKAAAEYQKVADHYKKQSITYSTDEPQEAADKLLRDITSWYADMTIALREITEAVDFFTLK